MIESRCGVLCSECGFRESTGCTGCLSTKTLFWGKCEVKECCEAKGFLYCGLCPDFPCSTLHNYSYDKEHGDDGQRIRECRKWKEDKDNE